MNLYGFTYDSHHFFCLLITAAEVAARATAGKFLVFSNIELFEFMTYWLGPSCEDVMNHTNS